jgi:hypothetical protein
LSFVNVQVERITGERTVRALSPARTDPVPEGFMTIGDGNGTSSALHYEHSRDAFERSIPRVVRDVELQAMVFDKAKQAAGTHLISGATLDELKAAASDLRALSEDSALAELVDAKIKQILSEGGQRPTCEIGDSPASGD